MPLPTMVDPFDLIQRAAVLLAETPTIEPRNVSCAHEEPVSWSIYDVPCGWEGIADVISYPDTQERIWECPYGHENYIRWDS